MCPSYVSVINRPDYSDKTRIDLVSGNYGVSDDKLKSILSGSCCNSLLYYAVKMLAYGTHWGIGIVVATM